MSAHKVYAKENICTELLRRELSVQEGKLIFSQNLRDAGENKRVEEQHANTAKKPTQQKTTKKKHPTQNPPSPEPPEHKKKKKKKKTKPTTQQRHPPQERQKKKKKTQKKHHKTQQNQKHPKKKKKKKKHHKRPKHKTTTKTNQTPNNCVTGGREKGKLSGRTSPKGMRCKVAEGIKNRQQKEVGLRGDLNMNT